MHLDGNLLVVVNVELSGRVRLTRSLEGNPDEVLSQDLGKDTVTQGTVFVEDLVDDILRWVSAEIKNIRNGKSTQA